MKRFLKMWVEILGGTRSAARLLRAGALLVLTGSLLVGCAVVPADQSLLKSGQAGVMKEVMGRKNHLVHLSRTEADAAKPVLLLLHGATDDPTEMLAIAREWRGKYDVILFSYNFHQPLAGNLTVVVFSYAAIVFRTAVIRADDPTLFADAGLVQLVPTAGGSFLARGLRDPVAVFLVSLASPASFAVRPYGKFAEEIWGAAGSRKFSEAIHPERMRTILLEGDEHSLAGVRDEQVQARYRNGIGPNVVMIARSAGVTHDYFPTHPVGLEYLRRGLEALTNETGNDPPLTTPAITAQVQRDAGTEGL